MGFVLTIIIMAAAIAVAAFARWKANQPYEPGVPRYINWNIIMILAGVVAVLMLTHIFALSGIEVGQGRRMR